MLLLAAAIFVGSSACRPCHLGIADAWSRTTMARSSGRAVALEPVSFTAAGHRYEIDGRTLRFEGGASSIDYYIGSNLAGRTWLREWRGYLFELPVTWYAQKQIWDASPGYANEQYVRLNRAVEPSCLQCHASQVRPVLGTLNRYGDPPFLENGVSCERCHGAGSEHVRVPAKAPMVNPARLDAERRDSVCSQCHLTAEARIERAGRRFGDFRAGDRLADFATYLVWKSGREDLKVTSHVEKLAASACKTAAGDKLWCGTCHDAHTGADKTQAACLGCHAGAHHAEETCAECHMPKRRAADAGHGVATDHSIPRIARRSSVPQHGGLTAFLGAGDDRAFGIAYAELGDPRARAHLLRAAPADWRVRLRLAALESDPERAAAGYRAVLLENPYEVSALVNLGAYYAAAGKAAEAAALWQRALVANPATEQAVLNLSRVSPAAEARIIVMQYLVLNPASPAAKSRMRELSGVGH